MDNKTYRQTLFDEYEESLFRLAVFDASDTEGALSGTVDEKSGTVYEQPSELQLAQFLKTVERYEKKKSRQEPKTKKRVFPKIAASAAAVLLVFVISMVTVEAFRLEVLNFLIRTEPEYTSLSLMPEDSAGEQESVMPNYVPAGYELSSMEINDLDKTIFYTVQGDDDKIIIFSEYSKWDTVNVDTENADYTNTLTINGVDATVIVKDDITRIYWATNDHIYDIFGTIDTEEIIQMAKSVEY